jgi:hypothetical protein
MTGWLGILGCVSLIGGVQTIAAPLVRWAEVRAHRNEILREQKELKKKFERKKQVPR